MLILNFAHPFTPEQLAQVESLTGRSETHVIHLPVYKLIALSGGNR